MTKYDVYDVFTPTKPARLTFVERDNINQKLVNAMRTPGKQIVVYGHSGSGKTTLLVNKLQQLYERHITTRCLVGLKFDQIILDAFDQLSPFYANEVTTACKKSISVQLSQDYFAIKSQVTANVTNETQTKNLRALPPQLTPQALARFIGEVNGCWVIEDFHKVDESERKKLSQTMKVFMDMADEYQTVKVIAIGAVDTARQVVEYDNEMRNRVAEINVPLMEESEIEQIINKGAKLLNIDIGDGLIKGISNYANGLASVCHHLCLNLCTSNEIYETVVNDNYLIDKNSLALALQTYLDEASDTIKKAFDNAFKQKKIKRFDNARLILKALSELPQDGAHRAEIYQKITKLESTYPQGNLTAFLKSLSNEQDNSLLRYDSVSGKYSFRDPIYRAFALAYFSKESPKLASSGGTKSHSVSFKIDKEFQTKLFEELSLLLSEVSSESNKRVHGTDKTAP